MFCKQWCSVNIFDVCEHSLTHGYPEEDWTQLTSTLGIVYAVSGCTLRERGQQNTISKSLNEVSKSAKDKINKCIPKPKINGYS